MALFDEPFVDLFDSHWQSRLLISVREVIMT